MPVELLLLSVSLPALLAAIGLPLLGDWLDALPPPAPAKPDALPSLLSSRRTV
jgi:hypothetical protein